MIRKNPVMAKARVVGVWEYWLPNDVNQK